MEPNKRLADRLDRITESKTLRMARLSRELKAKGIDIINLSLGEPDFDTPKHISDAAIDAIQQGYTKYPPVAGYADLREAIANKFLRENHFSVKPEQIVVSTGAKQSLANLVLSLIQKGDEVVIPAPYWVTYPEQVQMAGGTPVIVKTTASQDYKISAEQLDAALNEKTRMFIFSSPSNPTGSVYTQDELEKLEQVFIKYPDVVIISDEIYEHINYVGTFSSLSAYPSLHSRLVVVNGLSKAFAMTGWRLGYIAAPEWIAKACEKIQGQITSGTSSISQRAAVAALNGSLEDTIAMRVQFKRRRDIMVEKLSAIPGMKLNIPAGAFYLFIDVTEFFGKKYQGVAIENAEDLSMFLLEHARVSLVSGDAFGAPECIRISYASAEDLLMEAAVRMENALSLLQ